MYLIYFKSGECQSPDPRKPCSNGKSAEFIWGKKNKIHKN